MHRWTHRTVAATGLAAVLTLSGCAFITRTDVGSDGSAHGGGASLGDLSSDGRFAAITTAAALDPADTNAQSDAYVRDHRDGTTERVSVSATGGDGNGLATERGISADGRYVLFFSTSTNLLTSGPTVGTNLFVRDRTAGVTTLVTVTTDGQAPSAEPTDAHLSANGRVVEFTVAATNIAPGGSLNRNDVYVRDLDAATTTRVSVNGSGTTANDDSSGAGLSGDGNLVVFDSTATNLVAGTALEGNVFVRNRSAGTSSLVNVTQHGPATNAFSGAGQSFAITGNGRYVLFSSAADDLTPDDPTGGTVELYVRDLTTATTSLVTYPNGDTPPLGFLPTGISDDGRMILASGFRTGLTDIQTYVIDRVEQRITMVRNATYHDLDSGATAGGISADGRYITFDARRASEVVAGAGSASGVFLRSSVIPTITSTTPATAARGTGAVLQVTGTGFQTGATFDLGDGVSVGSVTIVDEHHATVSITVAPDARVAPRNVVVTDPGSGAGPGTGGTGIGLNQFSVT